MVSSEKFKDFIEELKELGCTVKEVGSVITFEKLGEILYYNREGKELSKEEAEKIISNEDMGYIKGGEKMTAGEYDAKMKRAKINESNADMGYIPNPKDQIPAEPAERL